MSISDEENLKIRIEEDNLLRKIFESTHYYLDLEDPNYIAINSDGKWLTAKDLVKLEHI